MSMFEELVDSHLTPLAWPEMEWVTPTPWPLSVSYCLFALQVSLFWCVFPSGSHFTLMVARGICFL